MTAARHGCGIACVGVFGWHSLSGAGAAWVTQFVCPYLGWVAARGGGLWRAAWRGCRDCSGLRGVAAEAAAGCVFGCVWLRQGCVTAVSHIFQIGKAAGCSGSPEVGCNPFWMSNIQIRKAAQVAAIFGRSLAAYGYFRPQLCSLEIKISAKNIQYLKNYWS